MIIIKKVKNKKQTCVIIIKDCTSFVTIKSFEKLTLEGLERLFKEIPEEFVDAFWTAFSCSCLRGKNETLY